MTLSEDARDVANNVVRSLPPAFVALLVINLLFVLGMLWFMHDIAITRIEAVTKIFQTCTTALTKN